LTLAGTGVTSVTHATPLEGEMKTQGLMLIAAVLLAGCAKPQAAKLVEVEMAPLEVGTKTPDYEVVAPNALQLAPGVRTEPVKDANGNQGFVVMRDNNNGGFISCGCIGATTSTWNAAAPARTAREMRTLVA
jgi:hypothetical protein